MAAGEEITLTGHIQHHLTNAKCVLLMAVSRLTKHVVRLASGHGTLIPWHGLLV